MKKRNARDTNGMSSRANGGGSDSLPGGMGIFEAASVVTLKLVGVSVPVALVATLFFRGLSFWLPMVPGLIFSRGARRAT